MMRASRSAASAATSDTEVENEPVSMNVNNSNSLVTSDYDDWQSGRSHQGQPIGDISYLLPSQPVASGSSWQACSLIVMNACLGAGILNLPSAFDRAGGIIPALVVSLVMLLFAVFGAMLLGWASDRAKSDNYQDSIGGVLGVWMGRLCAVFIVIYTYATCVTFLIVIGDQSDRLLFDKLGPDFCSHFYLDRRFVVSCLSCVLVLPLCFVKSIDHLKYASGAATLSVAYLVIPDHWTDVFAAVPSLCFGYQCHVSAVPVYACVRPRTLHAFGRTILLALGICFVTYAMVGSFGYLAYGTNVDDDLMSNMSTDSWLFSIGYVSFAIKTFLTYPIVQFCGRSSISSLYREFVGDVPSEWMDRFMIPSIWFGSSLVVAVFVPNMSVVIDFLGFMAVLFIFIFPGLCFLSMEVSAFVVGPAEQKLLTPRVVSACMYLVIGAFLIGLTFTQTITYSMMGLKQHKQHICNTI